ncbi:MAG: PIN domain-containing protein [Pseudomonadota bacterium]
MGPEMIRRLIDSVILIDHLNGLPKANHYIARLNPAETAISVITRAEILVGVEQMEETLVKAFLNQYMLLGIDKGIADQAASLRREHGWKLPDAFQAALCYTHSIKLVTRDKKDFDPKKHHFVEIPYQP